MLLNILILRNDVNLAYEIHSSDLTESRDVSTPISDHVRVHGAHHVSNHVDEHVYAHGHDTADGDLTLFAVV